MTRARKNCERFVRDTRGAVSVLSAISLIVIIGFTAAAVDIGSVYLDTRRLQIPLSGALEIRDAPQLSRQIPASGKGNAVDHKRVVRGVHGGGGLARS